MNALLLFVTLTSTIVLRSGDRIVVEGAVRAENGVVLFRADGLLYSMPASEVVTIEGPPETRTAAAPVKKLAVPEEERKRLIAELEKNHGGTAPAPSKTLAEPRPTPPAPEEREASEEWTWRRRARDHEESVLQARENLALLETRVDELRSKIRTLVTLGFHPRQFTYDSSQLERTLAQIPGAELAVTRAERAQAQFREDARRLGVLPGWLR
jgi:hypothetical protein